jgi:hypothetical protein
MLKKSATSNNKMMQEEPEEEYHRKSQNIVRRLWTIASIAAQINHKKLPLKND